MRIFLRILSGFVLGLVTGYGATLFGWIAYTQLFDVFDRDGGKIMGIAFGFAPLAGLATGLVFAVWLGKRSARAQ